jgi:hypothetical protein
MHLHAKVKLSEQKTSFYGIESIELREYLRDAGTPWDVGYDVSLRAVAGAAEAGLKVGPVATLKCRKRNSGVPYGFPVI